MAATLTSKGQLTLPKEIRDRLNLDAGAILDFQIQADNTIIARQVMPDARRIRGLLQSPHPAPLTVEQMDEAVSKHLRDKHAASQTGRKSTGRRSASTLTPCCAFGSRMTRRRTSASTRCWLRMAPCQVRCS